MQSDKSLRQMQVFACIFTVVLAVCNYIVASTILPVCIAVAIALFTAFPAVAGVIGELFG